MTAHEARQRKHTGEGWDRVLVKPFLDAVCAANSEIEILQIKEKFASLTIYTSGPPWVDKLARIFEEASLLCCEDCGRFHKHWDDDRKVYVEVQTNALPRGFWLKTLCNACRAERQRQYEDEQEQRSLKDGGVV